MSKGTLSKLAIWFALAARTDLKMGTRHRPACSRQASTSYHSAQVSTRGDKTNKGTKKPSLEGFFILICFMFLNQIIDRNTLLSNHLNIERVTNAHDVVLASH